MVSKSQTIGTYKLAGNAMNYNTAMSLIVNNEKYNDILSVGNSCWINGRKYSLSVNANNELVLVIATGIAPQTQAWDKNANSSRYIVDYSTDNFEHIIRLAVESNSLDSFQMPTGNYQWRVKPEGSEEWTIGEPVDASNRPAWYILKTG